MIYLIAFEILALIIFLVLIWKLIIDKKDTKEQDQKCQFCGFESVRTFDFCPVCKRDVNGKLLTELQQDYNRKN